MKKIIKQLTKMQEILSDTNKLDSQKGKAMNTDDIADILILINEAALSVCDQLEFIIFDTLSKVAGLELEYLKENIKLDLAYDMLEQYIKQEGIDR